MLPIKDENPTEITPYLTILFVVLNVLAWVMVQGAGEPNALMASVTQLGTVPCRVTAACPAEGGGGWVTLVTSIFLHGSWGHLLGNLVFLWVFGNNIEDSMGHIRFLGFYLLCGVAAGLAHVFLSPTSSVPAVGASGAISGIMGAYLVLYPRVRVHTWVPPFFFIPLPAILLLGYWFFIQLSMGVLSFGPEMGEQGGIAVWAHVGGFVAGVVLIKMFEKKALTYAKTHKIKLPREEAHRLEW